MGEQSAAGAERPGSKVTNGIKCCRGRSWDENQEGPIGGGDHRSYATVSG